MDQVIRLLPDHIANQIAAGEVVQRPASVVKELMENAIDAGATRVDLIIKDAGKTLVQVIDNGSGMNPQDARMAFERHATSQIRTTEDLFNIRTMGFREHLIWFHLESPFSRDSIRGELPRHQTNQHLASDLSEQVRS